MFTCPMHPEIDKTAPGSCPICGMSLEPRTPSSIDDIEHKRLKRRFWISLALTIPILFTPQWPWIQAVLCTGIVLFGGGSFFRSGWHSLRPNMFTLVSLGIGAAYAYSLVATAMPQALPPSLLDSGQPPLYFDSAAMITVLVLLGQLIEHSALSRTSLAIRSLLENAPKTATLVLVEGNQQIEVPIEEVRVGDILRVKPGAKVPVDGILVAGQSTVDESMITGEAVPAVKNIHDTVIGGTLNETGSFLMRAEKVGKDTVLAVIVSMVLEACRSKPPIQKLADTVSTIFVPIVMIVAAATFLLWFFLGSQPSFALVNAVAVLIIACPCALGLATPLSIMLGVGRGAEAGVLIKNGEGIETLERVNTLVIDKTGTLTEGNLRLTHIEAVDPWTVEQVLRFSASVERASEHPLASAIVRAAPQTAVVENFMSYTGEGLQGTVEHHKILVGKEPFLKRHHVTGLDTLESKSILFQSDANTVIFVAIDGKGAGFLTLTDPIKPSTPVALDELYRLKVRIIMVSGDNERTVRAVAEKLHIDEYHYNASPQYKHDFVRSLQARGYIVAMAGDGINDAPALAAADVGIAMGSGTDVAIENASVTLMKGDLAGISRAISLSHSIMHNIRQNLFLAFMYNVLAIPIAAGALYPHFGLQLNPVIAAACMSLSSLSVVGNALRCFKKTGRHSTPL